MGRLFSLLVSSEGIWITLHNRAKPITRLFFGEILKENRKNQKISRQISSPMTVEIRKYSEAGAAVLGEDVRLARLFYSRIQITKRQIAVPGLALPVEATNNRGKMSQSGKKRWGKGNAPRVKDRVGGLLTSLGGNILGA